jgi:hypothetical protein
MVQVKRVVGGVLGLVLGLGAVSAGVSPASADETAKAPKIAVFSSSIAKPRAGSPFVLKWRTRGAEKLRASGDWKGKRDASGRMTVRMGESGKHVFVLTAMGPGGKTHARVVVNVLRKAKELKLLVAPVVKPGTTSLGGLVQPGSAVEVSTRGLAAGEKWTLRLGGKVVRTGAADKKGLVDTTVTVPAGATDGTLPLKLTGSMPDRVGEADVRVIGPKALNVEVESAKVVSAGTQTVSVDGLAPNEPVTATYKGKEIASGKADAQGRFDLLFEVGGKAGQRTVTVTGALPGRTGAATFQVEKAVLEIG